ncbi:MULTISPECIES: hypothetical protein [unclassified Luteococcus]|uniref:hypothetical protein n=1 Tax=unclassified Luteococcus TaxID=2639923 RepID=UPI00313EAF91
MQTTEIFDFETNWMLDDGTFIHMIALGVDVGSDYQLVLLRSGEQVMSVHVEFFLSELPDGALVVSAGAPTRPIELEGEARTTDLVFQLEDDYLDGSDEAVDVDLYLTRDNVVHLDLLVDVAEELREHATVDMDAGSFAALADQIIREMSV